jgi:acyl-CoA oxidase
MKNHWFRVYLPFLPMTPWTEKWQKAIPNIGDEMKYSEAALKLRQLIQTNLLTLTDIQSNPSRFFEAHRIVAKNSCKLGPGFSIRFTVHYNLFAGTVIALGI